MLFWVASSSKPDSMEQGSDRLKIMMCHIRLAGISFCHRKLVRTLSTGLLVSLLAACGDDLTPQANDAGSTAAKSGSTPVAVTGAQSTRTTFPKVDLDVDLCEGMATHKERAQIKRVEKPPFMRRYRDPAFGATVIRITDSGFGSVHKPLYSTVQAWNADESRMVLYRTGKAGAAHLLLDGFTYEPLLTLDIAPTDLEEVFWSHTDPDTFFYVSARGESAGNLMVYSVSKNQSTAIKDFAPVCGTSTIRSGNDVQMQSVDDDLFGFRCEVEKNGEKTPIMFTYRISTDEFQTGELTKPWDPRTAPMPGPSGQRLHLQGMVLDTDLDGISVKLDLGNVEEHASLGLTHDGQDGLFIVSFEQAPAGCDGDTWQGVGHLIQYNLSDGACKPLVTEHLGWPYPTSGTHISAKAHRRPGWIAMSSIGYDNLDYLSGTGLAPALMSEIYLVNSALDRPQTCRLAQHRSFGKSAKNGGYVSYFGEPHVTISPSGTRLLFGSDWYDSGSVDAYVIELPAFKR